ncbi:MAG: hypothetical protein ABI147_13705 [Acidobacteriaceae bacterium]
MTERKARATAKATTTAGSLSGMTERKARAKAKATATAGSLRE